MEKNSKLLFKFNCGQAIQSPLLNSRYRRIFTQQDSRILGAKGLFFKDLGDAPTALTATRKRHMEQCRLGVRSAGRPNADGGIEPVSGLQPSRLVSIVKHWNRLCGNVHRRIPCK